MSFLIDLVVGIFDFILDVFTLRRLREHRGHRERSLSEDAAAVAHFDFITATYIGLASIALTLLLMFGLGLSFGLSVGIGIAFGVIWATWRYMKLVNES